MQQLRYRLAVEVVEVDYAYLAAESRDVADDLGGLCLADCELVLSGVELLDHFNERLDREGVVLRGDAELLLDIALADVLLGEDVELSDHLPRVLQELRAVVGERDATTAAVENLNAYLALELLYRRRQRRLRDVELLRCFVHGARLGNSEYVFELL